MKNHNEVLIKELTEWLKQEWAGYDSGIMLILREGIYGAHTIRSVQVKLERLKQKYGGVHERS